MVPVLILPFLGFLGYSNLFKYNFKLNSDIWKWANFFLPCNEWAYMGNDLMCSICAGYKIRNSYVKRYRTILMYVPCILYSLLSRPTNAQHIYKQYFNSILGFIKYCCYIYICVCVCVCVCVYFVCVCVCVFVCIIFSDFFSQC